MAFRGCFLLGFLVLLVSCSCQLSDSTSPNRTSFPAGFIFGTSSSAYQYEGAAREGGKGISIWDTFTHKQPEKIKDHSNGDIAVDQYHRYKEDVKIMKEMGMQAYRLSISWTRILPEGRPSGGVSKEGIRYYNSFINELLSSGIKPFVTLFHWDLPQTFEDEYNGFLSSNIVHDYLNYADVCFREFGDRVKHWMTFNEPSIFCTHGFADGTFAPGRCSSWVGNCSVGNSATEPYVAGHHLLLAHAAAVKLYRDKYQASQKGTVGIAPASHWYLPLSKSKSNDEAAQRILDFTYGWFMDPVTKGNYPPSMRSLVGRRLPKFSKEQSRMLKGSLDFIGLNYYTTFYATTAPPSNGLKASYTTDSQTNTTAVRNGVLIGPQAASPWLHVYPKGLRDLLLYTKKRYGDRIIYVTENGISEFNNETLPLHKALEDNMRIGYHRRHLSWLHTALREGVDVRGYFAWSLLDNFEWASGYTVRFGLNFVDYKDGLKRYPKKSAIWFKKFLKG